ncbi:DEAD/DEAH box family ATP-dependent RNA helicase [Spirochaetia bacterium]|nr:DEAD/DEAH box family ATP-dependent RNA helicase [Spirochaetia bacterium]
MTNEGGKGSFADLGIDPFFIGRLSGRNIFSPTEIQKQVIPLLLAGGNVLFRSATGTGKTFAYLIPIFQRLLGGIYHKEPKVPGHREGPEDTEEEKGKKDAGPQNGPGPLVLIAAPTYELCAQIKEEADFLLKGMEGAFPQSQMPLQPLKVNLLIGSANTGRQIDALKKDRPAIVVGNPGRLLMLSRMGKLKLRGVRFLVLDEGDRLTSDELFGETGELVSLLPQGRISASCSATVPAKTRERLAPLLGEAVETAETEEQEILRERISHWALFSEGRRKIDTLRSFIAAADPGGRKGAFKALVFSGGGGQPGIILSRLQYNGVKAAGLYGDMDRKKRKEAIDGFRSGKLPVLVSSDLAARGLDIPGVTHVIALDVPADDGAYIHRAGRTARAGKRGIMVTIGDGDEMRRLAALEKRLGLTVYPKALYKGKIVAPPSDEE